MNEYTYKPCRFAKYFDLDVDPILECQICPFSKNCLLDLADKAQDEYIRQMDVIWNAIMDYKDGGYNVS